MGQPNKAPEPELHQAWRRPQNQRGSWEKVPGIAPGTKSAVFDAVQQQLWIASEVEYEYRILPVGQRPTAAMGNSEPFSQTYRTKVMKPR